MSNHSTEYDTPTQHGNVSVIKTSLRSRMLISTKTLKEKTKRNHFTKSKKKKTIFQASLAEINMSNSCNGFMDGKENLMVGNEMSVLLVDENTTELTTPMENFGLFGTPDIENIMDPPEQKHSTPRMLKILTKAASSTPNCEQLNNSKLTRDVSIQTTFTLSARDSDVFNNQLKSYCVDVPDQSMICIPSVSQKSITDSGNDNKSPISSYTFSRKLVGDETPVQTKLCRRLSLRSKTMICSAIEKSRDFQRPNMLTRHKSVDERRLISNTFSTMPHHKTPPSYSEKVFHNPFDVDLPSRLGKSVFSPDVFDHVVSPSEDSESIRWTIEDISSINPVAIDENVTYPSGDEDAEHDSEVQQEIDRYFSQTHMVLSPYDTSGPRDFSETKDVKCHTRRKAAASTPQKIEFAVPVEFRSSFTQTALSLPKTLPDELEKNLKSYFKIFETDDFNLSASNLRRKLFFHSEDEPPSPVRFEACSSPSPNVKATCGSEGSPYVAARNPRYFTSEPHLQEVSSPEMSPVVLQSAPRKSKNDSVSTCKKTLHLYFPGDSTDTKQINERVGVVNSTVILTSGDPTTTVTADCSSASLALPASQDTGYHTEDSWPHVRSPATVMASTPTRRVQ